MRFLPGLALTLALVAASLGVTAVRGQSVPIYTANATTATAKSGTVHFLQAVNLALGPGAYRLDSLTIGLNFTTTAPETIRFELYSGVDTNPNSTNALANATHLGSFSGDDNPSIPLGAGNFAFTYTIPNGFTFTTTGNGALGIEVILTDSEGYYATEQNGRFTASVPTVGTSAGFVWNDADLDGIFTGAERTTFGMANANVRLALTGSRTALKSYVRQGTLATLKVDGFTNHTYQLQRSLSLPAAWTNVGDAQPGTTGGVLTFTDNDSADNRAFYRVVDTSSLPARPAASRRGVQQISSIPRLKPSIIRAD